ncbi:PH domain-containing protein [Cellulomonas hominis]|uniref:PH domain-containing protein n=1 Tax=Cellulomonas hominis TaxID=156981 RepID=UPI001C11D7AD|nr:PH domain-containing protein [Cellulomonas hominis]MBU5424688.1 PH domain-containing protein [Cellulomonas hominis]
MQTDVVEFRPRFGRWLVVMVAAVAGAGAVSGLVEDPAQTVRYLPVLALVVVLVWAAYWRPAVVVSPAGVEIRNVTRTIEIPWPAVQAVTTQYALTLQTAYGTYAAWAAPAPSRTRVKLAARPDARNLPETAYRDTTVAIGDLANTDSGQAAALVRYRWEELRDAGALDDPRLERPAPVVRWHGRTLALVGVLVVTGALAPLL